MHLYLVTKNHLSSDVNKRITATLFLWFMNRSGNLDHVDDSKSIADNALVAFTVMIVEMRTEKKRYNVGGRGQPY